jgi:hypothetical protein
MLKSTALGLAFTILLWQPAMAQSAVTVGYDFYTLHRALEAKSSGIEYDQDSSGFMFAAESEIDQDSSITFEYRDIGEGSFRCTTDFDVVEIGGENWFCDAGDEVETEASSFAVSYKTYNEKNGYWKLGVGSYRIIYPDSRVPEKDDTGIYIGWGIQLSEVRGRTGTYLQFGSILGETFGIDLAYQFNSN